MRRPALTGPGLEGPGFELVERTAGTIARFSMLERARRAVVAVSGGPDSICLLDVLTRLRSTFALELVVAHVDHGLAPGSADEAARVAQAAAAAGFEVHVVRAPGLAGPNLHARAREFRYGFLRTVAERVEADVIATGHTLDDRVETTLARLIHGAATEGLAGLRPKEGGRIRPLIGSRRAETRAYCVARSLPFFDDPANEDLRFERPAVRAKVLAAIEDHWGEGAVRAIATSSQRLGEDADALGHLSEKIFRDLVESADDRVFFDRRLLASLPRALRRRLLEQAVGRVRDRSGGIDGALDALDEDRRDVRFAVAGGAEIVVEATHVEVRKGLAGSPP